MTEYQYTAVVDQEGRICLPPPRPPAGTLVKVQITLLVDNSLADDLLDAASSSFGFWDNPTDDAIWNEA